MSKTFMTTNILFIYFLLTQSSLLNKNGLKVNIRSSKQIKLDDVAKKDLEIISFENGYRGAFANENIKVLKKFL
jgi:hypothetical protein